MEAVNTIEYRECTIEIHYDRDSESPRGWCNIGTILGETRNYRFSDSEAPKHLLKEATSIESLARLVQKELKEPILWFPIRKYEHSGVVLSIGRNQDDFAYPFTDTFDSCWVGIIYVPYSKIREEYSKKHVTKKLKDRVYEYLQGEIETYNQYLNGEVYGYIAKDAEDNEIDSCWGFYGGSDDDYMISVAKEAIDFHLTDTPKSAQASTQLVLPGMV